MPSNKYPEWLESLNYPAEGIGSGDDLKHSLLVRDNKWLSKINPGWAYLNNFEDYYYIDPQVEVLSAVGSGAATGEVTSNLNPGWGPVICYSGSETYLELANYLKLGQHVTWTPSVSGGYYFYNVPSGEWFSEVIDLTNDPLKRVSQFEKLITPKDYYVEGSKIYLRVNTDPTNSYFINSVCKSNQLQINELCWVKDGKINLTYAYPADITLRRGVSTQVVTGSAAEVDVSIANDYEWVQASYYVDRSFIITGTLNLSFYNRVTEDITVQYEGSAPYGAPTITVQNDTSLPLNFNPVHDESFSYGYLIVTPSSSSVTNTCKFIEVNASSNSFCPDWEEEVTVLIKILDRNKNPIPQKDVTLTLTGTNLNGSLPTKTNNSGIVLLRLTHTADIELDVESDGLQNSITVTSLTEANYLNTTLVNNGTSNLVITNTDTYQGGRVAYMSAYTLDGVPKTNTVSVRSETNSEFIFEDQRYKQILSLPVNVGVSNVGGITQVFSVKLDPQDKIWSTVINNQGKVLEVIDAE